ncbi:hypothetical protein FE257_002465 [Aspergillus nanangensis]|uniref:Nephrocystin 3-like N-terminal domain-containing protein n=1 Tax=Aspergillus nanangensis TaxID=2582783 RepID=A0AAD4CSS9_ASPNN|nr:hypothetical protein FE257_002465 [Aspergillus nanangensis]
MRVLAVFVALLAVAIATPSLEVRQQGQGCKEFHNERCEDQKNATEEDTSAMTTESMGQHWHDDYRVGWICALPLEAAAATALLDRKHPKLDQDPSDSNAYALGQIGPHNVVIGHLPFGSMGETAATTVARDMLRSFPNIRIGLLVGIGGGAPGPPNDDPDEDIRLGDIVVSKPGHNNGGVIQYDYGKTMDENAFVQTGYLNKPPAALLTALAELTSQHELEGGAFSEYISEMAKRFPRMRHKWQYPGLERDHLYKEDYKHSDIERSCEDLACAAHPANLVLRKPRDTTDPVVHYGVIASGNQVMRDGITREKLRKKHAAAAFAKELLGIVAPQQVERTEKAMKVLEKKLQEEFGKVNVKLDPIFTAAQRKERDEILDWISPDTYKSHQADSFDRHEEGTGKWFLTDPRFTAWSEGEQGGGGDIQTLFCPGLAGVGKTTIASIAIDHLWNARRQENAVVAFLYCNYKLAAQQTPDKMLRAILRQVVEALPSMPDEVKELRGSCVVGIKHPTLDTISDVVCAIAKRFSPMFLVLDALDECPRESLTVLLDKVWDLQRSGVRVMATSRPLSSIEQALSHAAGLSRLEIRADHRDVMMYIDRKFDFTKFYPNSRERCEAVQQTIVDAANGMFLLVPLYLNLLKTKHTRGELEEELHKISSGQSSNPTQEAYTKTIEMISSRDDTSEWAHRIMAWVFHARRPLHLHELQLALTAQVQRTSHQLDLDYAPPDIQEFISFCAGLVVVNPTSNVIGFMHYTTHQYFQEYESLHAWLADAPGDIAQTCLRYLSFDTFALSPMQNQRGLRDRLRENAFLDYAARFWGDHAWGVQEHVEERALRFLRNKALAECASQVMTIPEGHDFRRSFTAVKMGGVHLVASFGLNMLLSRLLDGGLPDDAEGIIIDERDSQGRTPVSWAALKGHESTVEELCVRKCDSNARDWHGETPISLAVRNGYAAVVDVLLTHGSQPDIPDRFGRTPLSRAAERGYTYIARQLLELGADPNQQDQTGQTSLWWAVRKGHENTVRLLLDYQADPEIANSLGKSPLSMCLDNGSEAMLEDICASHDALFVKAIKERNVNEISRLSQRDIKLHMTPEMGQVALSLAARENIQQLVEHFLGDGVDVNARDDEGRTALSWASEAHNRLLVKLLLEHGALPDPEHHGYYETLLPWAFRLTEKAMLRQLLHCGILPDSTDTRLYCDVLNWTIENHHDDVTQQLLENWILPHFEDPDSSPDNTGKINKNVRRSVGMWPIICLDTKVIKWTLDNGHHELTRRLLENRYLKRRQDTRFGARVYEWAVIRGHHAIMKQLLDDGIFTDSGYDPSRFVQFALAAGKNDGMRLEQLLNDVRFMHPVTDIYFLWALKLTTENDRGAIIKQSLLRGAFPDYGDVHSGFWAWELIEPAVINHGAILKQLLHDRVYGDHGDADCCFMAFRSGGGDDTKKIIEQFVKDGRYPGCDNCCFVAFNLGARDDHEAIIKKMLNS